MSNQEREEQRGSRRAVYIEDGLILVSIALLFWLGVLHRRESWAQVEMLGVGLVMAVVLIRRLRRVRRAFRE